MRLFWTAVFCLAISGLAFGQSYNLDDGSDWTVVGDEDTAYEFGFDYSKFGIPSAPNGEGTTGLWMAANIADPAEAAVISASPNGASVSGRYQVDFDGWINFNTSGGTTEFIGGFVGFDAGAGNPRSGAGILADSDGDSARDYRLYKDTAEQFVDSGQYNSGLESNNNSDALLAGTFPGATTPEAQADGAVFDPTNVIVTAADGTLGFAWHEFTIIGDADAGTAEFLIDGLSIGTVDSNTGDPVALSGGIALTHADLFSSVASKPEFAFSVFDNLRVTQVPEPSSALMAFFGFFAIAGLRRKR